MADTPPLLRSLLAALEARPDDVPLRLHVAELLIDAGRAPDALEHCSVVLRAEPGHAQALALIGRVTRALSGEPPAGAGAPPTGPGAPSPTGRFDWAWAERELADIAEPAVTGDAPSGEPGNDLERPPVRLCDVGGMEAVKQRLELAFLAPIRNPRLREMYGKRLGGGLLLYGPPGCGKTFLARALAGELGARFYPVSLADVLDMYIGQSERNLRDVFEVARRNTPCVLFLDEVDALGQKRINLRHNPAMRGTVNQLLAELDGVREGNEGLFVLAATNHPWDLDTALLRPGRFDRTVLVLPPDRPAREAILRYHLRHRPVAGVDLARLAGRTNGFSGADLAHLCDTAAERAMADALSSGDVRPIGMADLEGALREVRSSTGGWFDIARSVAMFAGGSGFYDDLVAYLEQRRRP